MLTLRILMLLSASFLLQMGISAQPQRSALEVQVQKLPSSNEGAYYDNSRGSQPQRTHAEHQDSRSNDARSDATTSRNSSYRTYDRQDRYDDNQEDAEDRDEDYDDSDEDDDDDDGEDDHDDQRLDYPKEAHSNGRGPGSANYRHGDQFNPGGKATYDQNRPAIQQRPLLGAKERTLSIIKPDGIRNNHIGDIISRFENSGLRIAAIKMVTLTKDQASQFYRVHRNRPFYSDLVNFMSSGPVIIMVVEGDQAIAKNRQLMGATDPQKADKGTIRADFAESVSQNAVHGSDSPEAAKEEILFFFKPHEIFSRY